MKSRKIFYMVVIVVLIFSNVYAQNASSYTQMGYDQIQKGQYYQAVISFKTALNIMPDNENAIKGLAYAYLLSGAYNESYKLFYRIIQLNPNDSQALSGAGSAQSGLHNYENALNYFNKAIEIKSDNIEAHYGIAEIYYLMKKNLWAERKLDTIFKMNPFHYRSLILHARIKSDIGRIEESIDIVKKAIDSDPLRPEAYLQYSYFLLNQFFKENDKDILNDSIEESKRALAVSPGYFDAYEQLGDIYYITDSFEMSLESYKNAEKLRPNNTELLYRIGLNFERMNKKTQALDYFKKSYLSDTRNDFLKCKLENYLFINDVSFGDPERVAFSKKHFEKAEYLLNDALTDRAIYYLRRSIYMNPLNRESRDLFMSYMNIYGYHRFYIDELKKMYKLFPESEIRRKLDVGIIKRRNMFYFQEGFATDPPERNVPKVLVVDFVADQKIPQFLEAGSVIADNITFSLKQFGRMQNAGVKQRNEMFKNLHSDLFTVNDYLRYIGDKYRYYSDQIDYLVYGTYSLDGNSVDLNVNIMNYKTGVVINSFQIYSYNEDFFNNASFKAASEIYNNIPYKGKIVKKENDYIVINLGSFDGVKKDDLFYIETQRKSVLTKYKIPQKILFKAVTVNTIVTKVVPVNSEDISYAMENEVIYPLKKKRAKMVK